MFRWSIVVGVLLPFAGVAQDHVSWTVGTRGAAGFLAPHHKGLWVMVDRHAFAGELYVQREYSGAKAWHGNYRRPKWGLSALWLDAGSNRLGPAARLITYLELPLVEPGTWEFSTRIGWGLGMVRDPFDRVDNYKQQAIGGQLNMAAQLALNLRRSFGQHALDLGLAMDHFSNASFNKPNLGINVPTMALGYAYRFQAASAPVLQPDSLWGTNSRSVVYAMASVGWNEVYPLESGRRSVFSLALSGYRRVSRKSAFGGGIDLFNKGSLAVMDSSLAARDRITLTQIGVHGGYGLLFGDLTLYFELGTYLYTPAEESVNIYTRVGLRQQLGERFLLNFTLKSHLFVADHFEVGIGYRLR